MDASAPGYKQKTFDLCWVLNLWRLVRYGRRRAVVERLLVPGWCDFRICDWTPLGRRVVCCPRRGVGWIRIPMLTGLCEPQARETEPSGQKRGQPQ